MVPALRVVLSRHGEAAGRTVHRGGSRTPEGPATTNARPETTPLGFRRRSPNSLAPSDEAVRRTISSASRLRNRSHPPARRAAPQRPVTGRDHGRLAHQGKLPLRPKIDLHPQPRRHAARQVVLFAALELFDRLRDLYDADPDEARKMLNKAIFTRLYLDSTDRQPTATAAPLSEPFASLVHATRATNGTTTPTRPKHSSRAIRPVRQPTS
jgi:hypothetical protein